MDANTRDANERRWTPLLSGDRAAEATRVIDEISEALWAELQAQGEGAPANASLASGVAGMGLLFAYRDAQEPAERHEERVLRCLDGALAGVAEMPMGAALYGGFTGIAWMMEHLKGPRYGIEDDANEETDDALVGLLETTPWPGDYDLISGLVGFGVYALERMPQPGARRALELVVARLDELARPTLHGLTWHTAVELLVIAETKQRYPNGYYNVGLAHGVPGIIALLGAICAHGVCVTQARRLLDGAVAWVLSCRQPEEAASMFPAILDLDAGSRAGEDGRSAWCYGDPGVAAALLSAARRVGEPAWEAAAHKAAHKAARRPMDKCGVVDAGICHGAAGLAHIYNRLFQATGEVLWAEAARAWIDRTFQLRKPGVGVAGYQSWSLPRNARFDGELALQWQDDPAFLTGATGIALVLLAAVSSIEPRWDRVLMVDM